MWRRLCTFILAEDWLLTPPVEVRQFRVGLQQIYVNLGKVHLNSLFGTTDLFCLDLAQIYTGFLSGHNFTNPNKYQTVALLALAAISETGKPELFKPQRIQPRNELEILQFPLPPKGWRYSLAAKQILLPNQSLLNWELDVDMPSYSLDDQPPINAAASTTKNVATVSVAATTTKVLPANPNRKGVKFYTADKTKTIYLDTDNVVSSTSAIESLTPSKNVCVPAIAWTGEWWAISSSGTVSIEVEEYL